MRSTSLWRGKALWGEYQPLKGESFVWGVPASGGKALCGEYQPLEGKALCGEYQQPLKGDSIVIPLLAADDEAGCVGMTCCAVGSLLR